MTKILFVCHGNICRSPMAEFMLKDLVKKRGMERDFLIASSATSAEEIGNPVHPGTASRLAREGISTAGKYAVQLKRTDYDRYDYFLGHGSMEHPQYEADLGGRSGEQGAPAAGLYRAAGGGDRRPLVHGRL